MKNKGITIIEMVVVVLILILLAIVALWSSQRVTLESEATIVYGEFKAVHTGVLKINQEYNLDIIEDYTVGEHFNSSYTDDNGKKWYVIYGMNDSHYDEDIIKNLGLDELKRNYKVNFETGEVEYLDGYVKVGEYEIDSYEDIQTLMESGAI